MSNLNNDHATVNDVIENVARGNVKLKGNASAKFALYDEVEFAPSPIPSTARITYLSDDGCIKIPFKCPSENTRGQSENPSYSDYWKYVTFADGSKLGYFPEVEWSETTIPLLTSFGGTIKFMRYNPDTGEYTTSSGGFWGMPIENGSGKWWRFDTDDPDPLAPGYAHWWAEPFLYTPDDTYYAYLFYWPIMDSKLGYGVTGRVVGGHSVEALYGQATKNYPVVQWGFSNGWTDLYDFLAGESAGGTQYPGEDSSTGGGDGTFYNRNDAIDFTPLPTLEPIDLGFTRLYNPHEADVRALASWLWTDDFVQNIKMNYSSPFDNILGMNLIALPQGKIEKELSTFVIGNTDSNVETYKITKEFINLDCGDVVIPEYWQNFLDYDTTFSIWLPYIGFRSLKADDILQVTEYTGGKLTVRYHIDLLTGNAVAEIRSIIPDRIFGDLVPHVLYSYNCNVFYSTPLSGANYMSMYNQQLNATANGLNNFVQSVGGAVGSALSGNVLGAVSSLTNMFTGQAQAKREYETAKPDYGRCGNSGGNSGYFSYKRPYIIKCQPIGQTPKNYKSLQGIPSQTYAKLSTLTGYTEVETTNIKQLINCTDEEQKEILRLLQGGVFL